MVSSLNWGPFAVLFTRRAPYYFGDRQRDRIKRTAHVPIATLRVRVPKEHILWP